MYHDVRMDATERDRRRGGSPSTDAKAGLDVADRVIERREPRRHRRSIGQSGLHNSGPRPARSKFNIYLSEETAFLSRRSAFPYFGRYMRSWVRFKLSNTWFDFTPREHLVLPPADGGPE